MFPHAVKSRFFRLAGLIDPGKHLDDGLQVILPHILAIGDAHDFVHVVAEQIAVSVVAEGDSAAEIHLEKGVVDLLQDSAVLLLTLLEHVFGLLAGIQQRVEIVFDHRNGIENRQEWIGKVGLDRVWRNPRAFPFDASDELHQAVYVVLNDVWCR